MPKNTVLRTFITTVCLLVATFSSTLYAVTSPPIPAKHAMVVTAHEKASQVGADILKKGGNAVDAAVAIGYALAVVHPCCGNIGGGGFMLIRQSNGQMHFINFREKAPQNIKPELFLDKKGHKKPDTMRYGYLPVGVPGTVKGLNYALKHYGSMSRQKVMAPAIHLAQSGFRLSDQDITLLNKALPQFKKAPNARKIFLHDGQPFQVGDTLKQPELAHSLKRIAKQGDRAFYHGPIGRAIVKASQSHGGVLSQADFDNYTITETTPITCHYKGYKVHSAPPPSSGGVTLCEALNILSPYPLDFLGFHSSNSVHFITEAERFAFADRNQHLGDPAFVNNPIKKLLSKTHIAHIRDKIQPFKALPSRRIKTTIQIHQEGNHTTHYSVVDAEGNAVAVTYTLNSFFGSKVVAGDTGIILNNQLADFAIRPGIKTIYGSVQGQANTLAPDKRPLSSMTPTIVTRNGQLAMVLGSPGGPTIITTVLQTLLNVIDYHMNIQEAVDAPRFHMQWLPDKIFMEPWVFSKDTQKQLQTMGYKLQTGSVYHTTYWGAAAAIHYLPETGYYYGAMDHRRPHGAAIGF